MLNVITRIGLGVVAVITLLAAVSFAGAPASEQQQVGETSAEVLMVQR
jgi:hypothetical protein